MLFSDTLEYAIVTSAPTPEEAIPIVSRNQTAIDRNSDGRSTSSRDHTDPIEDIGTDNAVAERKVHLIPGGSGTVRSQSISVAKKFNSFNDPRGGPSTSWRN